MTPQALKIATRNWLREQAIPLVAYIVVGIGRDFSYVLLALSVVAYFGAPSDPTHAIFLALLALFFRIGNHD